MKVYQAINAVQAALAAQGIAKNKRNTQGAGYNFRGIDDVYNALAPELANNGLVVIPRTVTRESVERVSKQGGALFYVVVDMEFDFVSAEDGSKHTARTFGEAMDSGDKATNKAMSAAFKYAMFQTFCIPTEAQDADAETHEVKPQRQGQPTSGVWEALDADTQAELTKVATICQEHFEMGDVVALVDYIDSKGYDTDQKAGLWTLLGSKMRTAIKKEINDRKGVAA